MEKQEESLTVILFKCIHYFSQDQENIQSYAGTNVHTVIDS